MSPLESPDLLEAGERLHEIVRRKGALEFLLREITQEWLEARIAMDVQLAIIALRRTESAHGRSALP
jgi:hypothetical protein